MFLNGLLENEKTFSFIIETENTVPTKNYFTNVINNTIAGSTFHINFTKISKQIGAMLLGENYLTMKIIESSSNVKFVAISWESIPLYQFSFA